MSWLHTYHNRIVSAEEALLSVKSGDRVYLTGNCAVPQVLMKALIERAPSLTDVEVCHILTLGKTPYADPAFAGHIRVNTLFIGEGSARPSTRDGRTSPRSASRRFRSSSRKGSSPSTSPSST